MSSATDEPSADESVRDQYQQARAMASELADPEYTAEFTSAADWKEYAVALGRSFRALDALLAKGATFPEEWVAGGTL